MLRREWRRRRKSSRVVIKAAALRYVCLLQHLGRSSACWGLLSFQRLVSARPSLSLSVSACVIPVSLGQSSQDQWAAFQVASLRLQRTGQRRSQRRRRRRDRRRADAPFSPCNGHDLTPEGSSTRSWARYGQWIRTSDCVGLTGRSTLLHALATLPQLRDPEDTSHSVGSPLVLVLSCSWSPCGRWGRARPRPPHRSRPSPPTSASWNRHTNAAVISTTILPELNCNLDLKVVGEYDFISSASYCTCKNYFVLFYSINTVCFGHCSEIELVKMIIRLHDGCKSTANFPAL